MIWRITEERNLRISEEVVAVIRYAATNVEGVAGMSGIAGGIAQLWGKMLCQRGKS